MNLSSEAKEYIYSVFSSTLTAGMTFLREECSEPVRTVDINVATSLCSLFQVWQTCWDYLKQQYS